MRNYMFSNINTGIQSDVFNAVATASATPSEVARFDSRHLARLSISIANKSGAALTSLNVLARGDSNGEWIPIPRTELAGYGRSDANTDIGTLPVGVSAAVNIDTTYWAEVKVEATSAGTSSLTVSAGAHPL